MLKINKAKWPELFAALSAQGTLYLPAEADGKVDFTVWQDGTEVDLQATQTAKSIKNIFFPQIENLLDFKTDGLKLSVEQRMLPEAATIAFGVRGCDVRSFEVLDKVFLKDPVDTFYKARRENCTIVSLACSAPDETCFCGTFAIDATNPGGDVTTWLVGDDLFWQANTDKGSELTEKIKSLLVEGDAAEVAVQQKATKEIMAKMPLADFKIAAKIPAEQEKVFNSTVWQELSGTCLSCCACTYVCPTCHCYDVRDFEVDDKVERFRCWDSCMCKDFTKMAAVNPRVSRLERFRQRYMHKLVYFPENNEGTFACVGCGRCLQKCPVNLNIVKVAKALEVAKDV